MDTFLVCSASAFIVLISGNYAGSGLTGIALIQHDLAAQLGSWAAPVMAIFIFMFAFFFHRGQLLLWRNQTSLILTKNTLYLNIFPRVRSYHGLLRFRRFP